MNSRMCVTCRKKLEKHMFFRISRYKNNIIFDKDYRLLGRGAYICKQTECINTAYKKNILAAHFKMRVNKDIYKELLI
jgi:uncharacterized protein